MRDILIAFVILGSIPAILARPYVGYVMWFVVSFMNPHQMGYGFVSTMPVAMMIAGSTVAGFIASKEPKRFPTDATTALIIALTVWVTITTLAALRPDLAFPDWNRAMKMFGMTLLMIPLINKRQRLHGIVWAIAISVGFWGVRGGLFTIITGGSGRVLGPDNTMMSDNNQLAAALVMIAPFVRYLQIQSDNRWIRLGLLATFAVIVASIFGSFSRGALVALVAMFLWLFKSSRHKAAIAFLAVVGVVVLMMIMPESWFARMHTMDNYQQDESVAGRFDAWTFAFRMALQRPITGGGFHIYADPNIFMSLVPEAAIPRAFHSIYFQAMGEHGFVGLALLVSVWMTAFFTAAAIRRKTRGEPDRLWAYDLASMTQVSLIGYAAAGAFLELAFFDLFYAIVMIPGLTANILRRETATEQISERDGMVRARPQALGS